jgi:hypothetical protein
MQTSSVKNTHRKAVVRRAIAATRVPDFAVLSFEAFTLAFHFVGLDRHVNLHQSMAAHRFRLVICRVHKWIREKAASVFIFSQYRERLPGR